MATKASVSLSFPLTSDFYSISKKVEEAAGHQCGDSGAGFGQRDMTFYFDSYEEAVAAEKRIKALKIKGLEMD